MHNTTKHNNAAKENHARNRLLRFALFTLGGMGMEGTPPPTPADSPLKFKP